ncbi:DUF6081 family protein [Streptomyces sp. NPDC093510]|uniref:DUF6081 family protein n=1 Tax=Streptomyces sp. NPDC093510 TaxID=3155199 RepID=UPI0034256BB0
MQQSVHVSGEVLFDDDFRDGLGAPWAVPMRDEATLLPAADGLRVVPAGTDPVTGQPAFAPLADRDEAAQGPGDHLKWVALARGPGEDGRGFEVPEGGAVECTTVLSARGYGAARHPFGDAVPDPGQDVRLAAAAMITMDPATHVVCDFLLTDTRVHALYERVPTPGSQYASFSYALPVARRRPGQRHRLSVSFEEGGTCAVWRVEGAEVLRIDRPGQRPADRRHLLLDHGGQDGEPVRLSRLVCAFGLLTLLDGAGPDGRGLVRPAPGGAPCYAPRIGAPKPQEFVADAGLLRRASWRPGAELTVGRVTVRAAVDRGLRRS